MRSPRSLGTAVCAAVILSGCSAPTPTVEDARCVETSAEDLAALGPQVRTYRGNGAAINQTVTVQTGGTYRLVAATISNPSQDGQHPESNPWQAVWILGGKDMTEVSKAWEGALPGTEVGRWPADVAQQLRQRAVECLLSSP